MVLFYFVIPVRVRRYWLLVASYFFYMSWNWHYGFLLLFCTLVSFFCGLAIERLRFSQKPDKKRWSARVLMLAVVILLTVLFFYKYMDFTLSIVGRVLPILHVGLSPKHFDIVLPVGISFFTFQAIGYVVDVWRGDIPAEHNFVIYALFVSFFPQLVAGPIERSKNLLCQLENLNPFDFDRTKEGLFLILWGLFLKMVIADRASVFVDSVYESWEQANGYILLLATFIFAFQIYCDFYGYSVIAQGAARILGIQLMDNFCAPYFAVSIQDFWRRWHISLSTWFRDYLYIPLGGSRCLPMRRNINILIVMLVSGLWHGAGTHFVAWGLLHGLLQVGEQALSSVRKYVPKSLLVVITFLETCLVWVFFRSISLSMSVRVLKKMTKAIVSCDIFYSAELFSYGLSSTGFSVLLVAVLLLVAVDFAKYRQRDLLACICKSSIPLQVSFVVLSILFISIYGMWGGAYRTMNFIYFQF